ncbi:DUF4844 domain-containing protein [Sphingobacterium sp. PCS056]|uniref:DUF4844 domain-containing protein n=1 Tax=Sphingobacterium sp. PCS056 TaxID=2931400 RepID=UPI00200BD582|nr:DUF4844 domain-containing protein [Sphingobacterium sp. PCS056]UPZ36522.1 DUF4844 domain-containing protein [Sphingobacterium sp. PCS056]
MPNRIVKERLMTLHNEVKFQQPLELYYPGLDNFDLQAALTSIVNKTIFEVYSKVDLGLVRWELIEILNQGLRSFDSFNLSSGDLFVVRSYYIRILIIVEWDCDSDELESLI